MISIRMGTRCGLMGRESSPISNVLCRRERCRASRGMGRLGQNDRNRGGGSIMRIGRRAMSRVWQGTPRASASLAVLLCSILSLGLAWARPAVRDCRSAAGGDLGRIHFPNSGAPGAQKDFLRGMLLLHSFEYDSARSAFQAAERIDPGFAMAYWGEALSYNQTLWGEQDLMSARVALARLAPTAAGRAAKAGTAREREYLASVEQLYGKGDKTQRDARYSAALGALVRRYPDDLNARSLYALSLLGLTNGNRNIPNYMRAAAQAEEVLQVDPCHPGALHYLIHATDDPVHAPLGLQAARRYSEVAPAAEHAQHMPSHIYFALGMWDDAIRSNIASVKISRAQHRGGYHALLWLIYAYLQEDERKQAEQGIELIAHDVATGVNKENRARLAYARATWLVETRGAAGADARVPVDSSGITSIRYFVAQDFARGITAGTDLAQARTALEQLQARIAAARAAPKGVKADWLDMVTDQELEEATIMADALEGVIRYDEGDRRAGIAAVTQAVAASEHLQFEYGPPWSVKPLDELLGELLLADGQSTEAAAAFERTLAVYPNRRLALEGLAASRGATSRRPDRNYRQARE